MIKYRIVKTYDSYHTPYYRVEERILLLWWLEGRTFDTMDQAEANIESRKHADARPKDAVVALYE